MREQVPTSEVAGASSFQSIFEVKGMTCQNCARHVREAAEQVSGVSAAQVELEGGRLQVRWQGARNDRAVIEAVEQAGYQAATDRPVTELIVEGMDCGNCARHVGEALRALPEISSVDIDLKRGRARIEWVNSAKKEVAKALAAIQAAGYQGQAATAESSERSASWSPLKGWLFNVFVGSAVTVILMVAEWVFGLGMNRAYQWTAFFLVLPVQFVCGARFYRGAWNQLKIGRSNMDTLVALGSTTAFLYSAVMLFMGAHGHLYFMESAAIISLISVGHWLESKVAEKAAGSLRALLNLAPQTARKLEGDKEVEVPLERVMAGDLIVLKPGDKAPTDGEVVEGRSAVDESMLTGESVPVEKEPGAKVYGGTVNQNGRLVARVTATGEATALAQIISVVQRAQSSRANIQRLGDQVSNVFVPAVVLIAIGTGLWWGFAPESAQAASRWLEPFLWTPFYPEGGLGSAIFHVAAVLIIACPCAMGLATPAAIMAGTNAAARRGILIRDGLALEKSGRLTAVVFDKTGTLTRGKLSVAALAPTSPEATEQNLRNLAASMAKPSTHPLSQAVAQLSPGDAKLSEWMEVRGSGVQALSSQFGSAPVRLGSILWLKESGVSFERGERFIRDWSKEGATLIGLAAGTRLLACLALRDQLKTDAAEVVAQLRKQGKKVFLITGDQRMTAEAIALQAGIPAENVFAEIRPEEKANLVKELQGKGERIAFIGDGINDAPALEQADLGVAVSKASDVAREAADIILLNSDIHAIPEALGLAQATLRTIKQNLFWAFFYNAASIPLAMLGFMSPILSAAAMGMSDLVVLGNALRLKRRR